ncbi:L-seryl-tRNA(Sec) selenium transferase [Acidobacterium sp. S8]|uniref:L-seryl-tRNA(Sec) selenium transferase n=1 Tax=Acidobacterium sp. S8 TaxID=1641854 RepID=UPI00131AC12B|nr:L-seryl-tRNA(Sec) selenium transferase [Acidobacterium sp. S8]
MKNDEYSNEFYRLLPSVNDLLLTPGVKALLCFHSHDTVASSIRDALSRIREEISDGQHTRTSIKERLASLEDGIVDGLVRKGRYSLRPVINATGVILHTNLGRASLSQTALDHIVEVAKGYCNLEFDLTSGERSSRDVHVESLILRVLAKKTGANEPSNTHRALVVNNCAAATFIALNTLAEGKEVLISRGELIEIGGGFRIPEILRKSGATLREVGTTNRTSLSDYERAISPDTGLILRVHQSNFSMHGFVTRPQISELAALGKRSNVSVFEDQGTGLIFSLEAHGILCEQSLLEGYRQGSDLLAASGDKLLGGPQCGLLIGRKDLIERIRQNPLLRTYRVDKLTYAALEATLLDHVSGAADSIPTLRMIGLDADEIKIRCHWIASKIPAENLFVDVVPTVSVIGGGTTPDARLSSYALSLRHATLTADELLSTLRQSTPPVIGRISEGNVLLDLRTVDADLDTSLATLLRGHHVAMRTSVQMSDR